jgi:hypothetical protein
LYKKTCNLEIEEYKAENERLRVIIANLEKINAGPDATSKPIKLTSFEKN